VQRPLAAATAAGQALASSAFVPNFINSAAGGVDVGGSPAPSEESQLLVFGSLEPEVKDVRSLGFKVITSSSLMAL